MKVDGRWVALGSYDAAAAGLVALPSLRLSRAGAYPLRLVASLGVTYYAGIEVTAPSR